MGYIDCWVIYDHPSDYSEYWVVRAWRTENGTHEPGRVRLANTLWEARGLIPIARHGLSCFPRAADDDPAVYETWL